MRGDQLQVERDWVESIKKCKTILKICSCVGKDDQGQKFQQYLKIVRLNRYEEMTATKLKLVYYTMIFSFL